MSIKIATIDRKKKMVNDGVYYGLNIMAAMKNIKKEFFIKFFNTFMEIYFVPLCKP